jgi:uncharacterized beta-barrel protein YwiB (DUF1934 family)
MVKMMTNNPKSNQDVKINLQTSIVQEGEKQTFTFNETGNLVTISDNLYLRFKEHQKHREVASVTIKFTDGEIQLTRQDQVGHHSRLVFIPGQITHTVYQTPYGPINLQVKTTRSTFNYQTDTQSGDLHIEYQLYSNKMIVGEYNITLHFAD